MKISAIILVGGKYDGPNYKRCLDSLFWVDEIVKIQTVGMKGSFADWRNLGAKKAKGDWLFYVDTDEEITKDLQEEISRLTSDIQSPVAGYAIPRRNLIWGQEMKHCGLWPDYVLRLIKKDKLERWQGELHEQPKISGEICHLKEPLIHRKDGDLSAMVEKTNDWSEIEARLMFDSHHPRMNFFRFASAGLREFWLRFIIQMAFLDGPKGIIYGLYQIFSRLISYSKLWEMQIKEK